MIDKPTSFESQAGSAADWRVQWRSAEHGSDEYGDLFFKRAVGVIDEMESSKAAAKRIAALLQADETLVDVGCGAGHYLRSLRREIPHNFQYRGLDATPQYIELARKAFADSPAARFEVADIFNLNLENGRADVTMCNNVLLHLPSVAQPLKELVRISRRHLLIRTLVSDASYVVRRVTPSSSGDEFDAAGEPLSFHFLNIYSKAYLTKLLAADSRVESFHFELDEDFDAARVSDSKSLLRASGWNGTQVVDGMQRSGMLLMPWTWISIQCR